MAAVAYAVQIHVWEVLYHILISSARSIRTFARRLSEIRTAVKANLQPATVQIIMHVLPILEFRVIY